MNCFQMKGRLNSKHLHYNLNAHCFHKPFNFCSVSGPCHQISQPIDLVEMNTNETVIDWLKPMKI